MLNSIMRTLCYANSQNRETIRPSFSQTNTPLIVPVGFLSLFLLVV